MRKQIFIFLGLLLFIFVADRVFSKVLLYIAEMSEFRYSKLYDGRIEADYVIIGNSRGNHAFYVPFLNSGNSSKFVNLSYNALPIKFGTALVKDYVRIYGKPKAVILEGGMMFFGPNSKKVLNEIKLYQSESKNIKEIYKETLPTEFIVNQIFNIYSFNSEMFLRSLYYLNKSDETWINRHQISETLIDATKSNATFNKEVDERSVRELRKLVNFCNEENIELKVIMAPTFPGFIQKIDNYEDKISNIEKTAGVSILDYTLSLHENRYFSDYEHLNQKGSEAFINLLRRDKVI